MSQNLTSLGIYSAIAIYVRERIQKGESILEWKPSDKDLALLCKDHELKYSELKATKAEKIPVRSLSKGFVVCLNGTPFEDIPKGTRMIVVTSGYSGLRAYDNLCQDVNHLYQEGAVTIQHQDLFVTYGVRA